MSYMGLLADFGEQAGVVVLPLLLVTGLAAVIISGLAAVIPPESRLTRVGHAALSAGLAVALAWLVKYAMGPDTYYTSGVSRWEHADRFVGTFPVAAAMVTAGSTSVGLALSAAAPRLHLLRSVVAPAAALSCLLLMLGWFWLTGGH